MKKYLLGLSAAVVASPAFAVIDTTAAVAGIGDAQTALVAVIGALMTLSVTLLGTVMVYRFIARKAGS